MIRLRRKNSFLYLAKGYKQAVDAEMVNAQSRLENFAPAETK